MPKPEQDQIYIALKHTDIKDSHIGQEVKIVLVSDKRVHYRYFCDNEDFDTPNKDSFFEKFKLKEIYIQENRQLTRLELIDF